MIPRHLLIAMAVLLVAALGLGLYALHMRRTVAVAPVSEDTRPLAPPVAGPSERVTLFVAYDSDGTLHAQSAQIPLPSGRQQRAEELIRALLSIYLDKSSSPHVLGSGADVRSVFLIDPGVAVIDLNSAFADTHRSGVLVEELTVTSLIHTISANTPGIQKVKILVEGRERETLAGHADLTGYYDVTAVNQVAVQLQSGQ